MPTFPTFTNDRNYEPWDEDADEGRIESEALDKTYRVRFSAPTTVLKYRIRYPYLTKADWATLIAFYNTNRAVSMTFPLHDGATLTNINAMFTSRPKRTVRNGESVIVEFGIRTV